jgi:hypothetical protein
LDNIIEFISKEDILVAYDNIIKFFEVAFDDCADNAVIWEESILELRLCEDIPVGDISEEEFDKTGEFLDSDFEAKGGVIWCFSECLIQPLERIKIFSSDGFDGTSVEEESHLFVAWA